MPVHTSHLHSVDKHSMGKLQKTAAYHSYKVGRLNVSFQLKNDLNVSRLGDLEDKDIFENANEENSRKKQVWE